MNTTNLNHACPWGGLQPATIQFCEERLCAWITEPANAWSNIGHLLVGLWILRCSRRENLSHLAMIGWISIAVAFGSTWFHATSTFAGEIIDLSAMFFFANYYLVSNLRRTYQNLGLPVARSMFWILTAFSLAMLMWKNPAGILIFTILVTVTGLIEIRLAFVEAPKANRFHLWLLVLCFVMAFIAWNLDIRRIVCDPSNHYFQGHSFWHLVNSLCFYWLYRFFSQFKSLR